MPEITELKELLTQQGQAFEEFKAANDQRLQEVEKTGQSSAEITEKVERINEAMAKLEKDLQEVAKKANRPAPGSEDPAKAEYRALFDEWARKGGDDRLAKLREMHPAKGAITTTSSEDGYLAVPEELDRNILTMLRDETPMRQVANVMTVGTPEYTKLVNAKGTTAAWVGEEDSTDETDTPKLKAVKPFMGILSAKPQATMVSLNDIFFDVEAWLTGELREAFAEYENSSFTSGNGSNQPKGFLSYTSVATADATRSYGQLEYLPTGVSDDFAATDPQDILIDMEMALKAGYRANASWMLNTSTLKTVRKWKDGDGNYIWQPGLQAGQPALINGYPFVTNENMPSVASGTLPIAFGDFRRGYYIVDIMGTTILRDPYTNTPYVQFKTYKRVGGMLVDSQAIKLMKCSAA